MEVASKLISASVHKDAQGNPVNPLDAHSRSLKLSRMEPIAHGSREFGTLQAYARDTHGATHRHYDVEVLQAFRVERCVRYGFVALLDVFDGLCREHETKAWNKAGYGKAADGDRLLLWHGSRTTNFAGILKQGLRIAPPEGTFVHISVTWVLANATHSSRSWLHVRQGCLFRRCASTLVCLYL